MPARDGTGPNGLGAKTGRGLGACTGTAESGAFIPGCGYGRRGCGRPRGQGFGRGFFRYGADSGKDLLKQQRDALQKRVDEFETQVERL